MINNVKNNAHDGGDLSEKNRVRVQLKANGQ